jgi:3-dehydroquinate synthase
MSAELHDIPLEAIADGDEAQLEPIHLEMRASKDIHYSIIHTPRPVFHEEELTLSRMVGARPVLFVVDRHVDGMYGASLRSYGRRYLSVAGTVVIEGGESNKTWQQTEHVCNAAMECGFGREGVIIGVGGGVVLDVSGFAASIFRRGVGYLRVPTTLVGQIDVSVGIKQGVNSGRFKNVLGTFYPPLASINDACFLKTLSPTHIAAGFAEIIKMAVITDPDLLCLVELHGAELLATRFQSPTLAAKAVMRRAETSMLREIEGNLFESNLKRLVDFGHTFSVAIESDCHYLMPHGHAVGLDMLISTGIAVGRGLCPLAVLDRMMRLYRILELPLTQRICSAERLLDALAAIRAHRGGALNLVVPRNIGQPIFLQDVSIEELQGALEFLTNADSSDGRFGL